MALFSKKTDQEKYDERNTSEKNAAACATDIIHDFITTTDDVKNHVMGCFSITCGEAKVYGGWNKDESDGQSSYYYLNVYVPGKYKHGANVLFDNGPYKTPLFTRDGQYFGRSEGGWGGYHQHLMEVSHYKEDKPDRVKKDALYTLVGIATQLILGNAKTIFEADRNVRKPRYHDTMGRQRHQGGGCSIG